MDKKKENQAVECFLAQFCFRTTNSGLYWKTVRETDDHEDSDSFSAGSCETTV